MSKNGVASGLGAGIGLQVLGLVVLRCAFVRSMGRHRQTFFNLGADLRVVVDADGIVNLISSCFKDIFVLQYTFFSLASIFNSLIGRFAKLFIYR